MAATHERRARVTEPAIIVVDARGHQCPTPTLRLRRALEAAADGARLRLMADDPLAAIDVPLFLKQMGYRLEHQQQTGSILTFDIIKARPEAQDAAHDRSP